MNLKNDCLLISQHFHGNGSAGSQLRQTLHVFVDVIHRLTVNLLDDVATPDASIMCGLSCHHDVGTQSGNGAGSHNVGHQP